MKIVPPQVWREKENLYTITFGICEKCGNKIYPYRPVCNKCGSTNVRKEVSQGKGVLTSFTVSYQHREGYERVAPTVVGTVLLDEGIEIVAPIAADPSELKQGMRVQATLRRYRSDSYNGLIVYGIKFRPAD